MLKNPHIRQDGDSSFHVEHVCVAASLICYAVSFFLPACMVGREVLLGHHAFTVVLFNGMAFGYWTWLLPLGWMANVFYGLGVLFFLKRSYIASFVVSLIAFLLAFIAFIFSLRPLVLIGCFVWHGGFLLLLIAGIIASFKNFVLRKLVYENS